MEPIERYSSPSCGSPTLMCESMKPKMEDQLYDPKSQTCIILLAVDGFSCLKAEILFLIVDSIDRRMESTNLW